MKPRRAMLRKIVLSLSVVSIVAVGWLWMRSYRKLDELSRVSGLGVIESIVSFRGGLHFSQAGDRASERGWSWDAYTISPGSDWDVLYFSGVLEFRRLGFGWLRSKPFTLARPFGNTKGFPLAPWLNATPYNAVIVPYWFVVVLLAAPWWWRMLSPLIARLRPKPGACRRCGYDLRATPGRCPECGLVPRRKPVRATGGVVA